jgi:transposase
MAVDCREHMFYSEYMAGVDRNNPKNASSSDSRYTLMQFMREFPDDATCLEHLWRARFSADGEHAYCPSPSCKRERTFKRYETKQQRQSWTCTACGRHIHPTAGTIWHKSSTSLHLWFYVMYLMTSTRCGISAKQVEREIGVNYKTAARMMRQIRTEMAEDTTEPLEGEVEADEMYVGGKPRVSPKRPAEYWLDRKTPVVGMVERGGRIRAQVTPLVGGPVVRQFVRDNLKFMSTLYTDDSKMYLTLGEDYFHHTINHSKKIYATGATHTQTIEGFWATVKNGLRGVYHGVSPDNLQSYVDEYVFRYNTRNDIRDPFLTLLNRAARA